MSQQSKMRCELPLAVAVATSMASLGTAQVTTTQAGRPSAGSGFGTMALHSESNLSSGADIFLPGEESVWIGWGFHYDPITDTVSLMGKVASFAVPPPPAAPGEATPADAFVRLESSLSQTSSFSHSSSTFSFNGAIGLVKAAASLTLSSSGSVSHFGDRTSLVWEKDYGMRMARFYPQNGWTFTAAAQNVLRNVPASQRGARWRALFGEYVAVGVQRRARLEMRAELLDDSSSESSSAYASLDVRYGTAHGSASYGNFAESARRSTSLSLSLHGEGIQNLASVHLPESADFVADAAGTKRAFLGALQERMQTAFLDKGLLLVPARCVPGAPDVGPETADGFVVGEAALQVRLSLVTLKSAKRWTGGGVLPFFLSQWFAPASSVSLAQELDAKQFEMVVKLRALWDSVQRYLIEQSPQAYAAITDPTLGTLVQMQEAREALDVLLNEFDPTNPGSFLHSIPGTVVSGALSPGQRLQDMSIDDHSCEGAGSDNTRKLRVRLDKAALFTDGTSSAVVAAVRRSLTFSMENACEPQNNGNSSWSPPWGGYNCNSTKQPDTRSRVNLLPLTIDTFQLVNVQPSVDAGGLVGLIDVEVEMDARMFECNRTIRVTFRDDLDRLHAGVICLADDWNNYPGHAQSCPPAAFTTRSGSM